MIGSRVSLIELSTLYVVGVLFHPSGASAQQLQDPAFDKTVMQPAYVADGPRIGFDEAHANIFTLDGRSRNWAELLQSDGYEVVAVREPVTGEVLSRLAVYVVATARPNDSNPGQSALTSEEIESLYRWVEAGGSLLILGEHHPLDIALDHLAARFGARFSYGVVGDSANYDRTSAHPAVREGGVADQWIVYTRENGLLRPHAITDGRSPDERLNRILTFGGSSVLPPPGASQLLVLAATATNRERNGFAPQRMGTAQAIAMAVGHGRVVITADATMFTAQVVHRENMPSFKLGMSRTDFDNRQFALNVMRWLTGKL